MTEYVDVSWSGEPVSVDKLQQMSANIRHLKENQPTVAFDHNSVKKYTGLKILFGSEIVQPGNAWNQRRDIFFGNFFSTGCNPVVIPTHYGHPQTGVNIAPLGLGMKTIPDNRGFQIYMWADGRDRNKGKIVQPIYIAYVAGGW